jgi:hypothetical protein
MNYKENKDISDKANNDNDIGNRTNADNNTGDKRNSNPSINLNSIERASIGEMLTYTADTLFSLLAKAKEESDRANIRRKWIEGVIELKYKTTINDFYKKAFEYINNEPIEEMDRYHKDLLIYYIPDVDNKENLIKVEFYRSISDISGESQIKKRLSLVKRNNHGGCHE